MGESLMRIKQFEIKGEKVTLWEVCEYNDPYYLVQSPNFVSNKILDLNTANVIFESKLGEMTQNETSN